MHHLRMTGSFSVASAPEQEPSHVRLRYHLDDDTIVRYRDPRRFGTLRVFDAGDAEQYLAARLGPEPLGGEFTGPILRERLRGRRAPLKAALLDQRVVAGLGNIYVDEALHMARLHPMKEAGRLSPAAAQRLVDAIRERLSLAIEVGGSTLRDYTDVEGSGGSMQERFVAYGRAGQPCERCGRALTRGVVAGRGTTWCAHCQRR
jgi:formamidopyrimidine-DNA glycosylase